MGFLDGPTLWTLTPDWSIDFVIPANDKMQIMAQARSLCRETDAGEWLTHGERPGELRRRWGQMRLLGQVSVVGVSE